MTLEQNTIIFLTSYCESKNQ